MESGVAPARERDTAPQERSGERRREGEAVHVRREFRSSSSRVDLSLRRSVVTSHSRTEGKTFETPPP